MEIDSEKFRRAARKSYGNETEEDKIQHRIERRARFIAELKKLTEKDKSELQALRRWQL